MKTRKIPLISGKIYHIFSKSIAGFKIFRSKTEYERMRKLFGYYMIDSPPLRFSSFLEIKNKDAFYKKHFARKNYIIEIIAYCIMPTHIHLLLKQIKDNGISMFMRKILDSYSRYFNVKNKRKGPLWQGRFKNVLIETDEQLLHLTRYIHLNPTSKNLIDKPENWQYSSYREYLGLIDNRKDRLCDFSNYLHMKIGSYKRFTENNINYQKELEKIKHLTLE